jgi:imidazolonepropionase-like amidohydrolase
MKKLIRKIKNPLTLLLFILIMPAIPIQAIVPTPAGPQEHPIAITGATIHTGNGDVIENGVITFSDGKITSVSHADDAKSLEDYEIIAMQGKHLYPGFVLPDTSLGLVEVNSVRATLDALETGMLNPNVRSIVAYNTDSELIPTLRFNGVLTAQTTPLGTLVSGFSSIVKLDGWNWEDAAYAVDDGIHLYWPAMYQRRPDYTKGIMVTEKNENYDELVATLPGLFQNASVYEGITDLNLKLGAIKKLNDGQTKLYIHADGAREIVSAVRFAMHQKVKSIVLVGAREALNVKDFLLEHKIPVIIDRVHGLPDSEDADIDQTFKKPAQLVAAGLTVGLGASTRDPMGSRNLPFMAGTAAAYGLDKEAALTMITRTNAEILGIADRLGTLEPGKDATLFVSKGDALDMRGNQLLKAYIQGRDIDLNGTQQQLFERYRKKYSSQTR